MQTEKKAIYFIFTLALMIRIVAFAFLGSNHWVEGDSAVYRNLGQNILTGKGFRVTVPGNATSWSWWNVDPKSWYLIVRKGEPTLFYEPAFPILMAGSYAVFGSAGDKAYLVLQLFLGAWLCVLIYILARKISRRQEAALIAGFMAALYPYLVFYSIVLMTETLFLVLFLCIILQGMRHLERPTFSTIIILSVLIALGALTRSFMIVAIPVVLIALLAQNLDWRVRIAQVLICASVCTFFFGAWMTRNYLTFHKIALLPTKGSWNFFDSMAAMPNHIGDKLKSARMRDSDVLHWDAKRIQEMRPDLKRTDLCFLPAEWDQTELGRAQQLTDRTVKFIMSNKLFALKRYFKLAAQMYLPFMVKPELKQFQYLQGLAYTLVLILGVYGWWLYRDNTILLILAVFWLVSGLMLVPVSHMHVHRVRLPLDVLLIWWSSGSMQMLMDRWLKKPELKPAR